MNRKTANELSAEYEVVVQMLECGKTALEIQAKLGLNAVQLKSYLAKAAMNGIAVKKASYKTVYGRSLPEAIRELYSATEATLFKFTPLSADGVGQVTIISQLEAEAKIDVRLLPTADEVTLDVNRITN